VASATASTAEPAPAGRLGLGSLSRRLLLLSVAWIAALLLLGGFALDRILTDIITRSFDQQPIRAIAAMISAAELDQYGELRFNRPPVDPRFSEPYSGYYWQVSSKWMPPFPSRSLWDRHLDLDLDKSCVEICVSRSDAFPNETLRIVERDGIIPGSSVVWRFAVAQNAAPLDRQLAHVRGILWWSLGALGLGLFLLGILQATVGLRPLRRMSAALADIRAGRAHRVSVRNVPEEIAPLVDELNALLDHNERTAEAARMHAGNLAHALKTPMSVLTNAAAAGSPDLAEVVVRELSTMRRHIDHHLARARAVGRRTDATARAEVWPALERLRNAIERIYADRGVVIDLAGDRAATFRGERQDLEEMAGNLLDNAAKYGGGRVFVTVGTEDSGQGRFVTIQVEDDGPGIPERLRDDMFERGRRLDTGKPGTGLGLAIVRDVAEIYGGSVDLGTSEDLGGLMVTLRLPAPGRHAGIDAEAAASPRNPARGARRGL
jgi:signal transduction histidine kinase